MVISEGHFPFVPRSVWGFLGENIPSSLVLVVNFLALWARWQYWSTMAALWFWFLPQLVPAMLMKKICRISSKAGNPLGLGKWKCVIVWLFSRPGPLDPLRLCSNRLAVMALCFWYNYFCVGFCCETFGFKVFECIWKCTMCFMLSSDMCK